MSKITFKPANGRVLIKPDEKETETPSGILIPDTANTDAPVTGVVIVGSKEYPKDKRVLFNRFGYDEFKLDGEKYYTVATKFILGVF